MTRSNIFQFLKLQNPTSPFLCVLLEIWGKHNTHQVKGMKNKGNEEKEVTMVWVTYRSKKRALLLYFPGFFLQTLLRLCCLLLVLSLSLFKSSHVGFKNGWIRSLKSQMIFCSNLPSSAEVVTNVSDSRKLETDNKIWRMWKGNMLIEVLQKGFGSSVF